MNKKRLLKLADFLDGLHHKKFYYPKLVKATDDKGCGTVCCALGWAPKVFPGTFSWKGRRAANDEFTGAFFGIDYREMAGLFLPGSQARIDEPILDYKATPKEVAAMIRRFVAKKERSSK